MDEITIVTAYFNIGREKWKGYERAIISILIILIFGQK